MQPFPHVYVVGANAGATGSVALASDGSPGLACAAPKEFDGPGDQWSPEALLCAAVASCFVRTFRSVARASGLQWRDLDCHVEGSLERVDGVTRFTRFTTRATLAVAADVSAESCRRALEKAERSCLILNSLQAARDLQIAIVNDPMQEKVA